MSELSGIELREAVAREVMGCQAVSDGMYRRPDARGSKYLVRVPAYESDIAAAWAVVEKVTNKEDADGYSRWYFELKQSALGFTAEFYYRDDDDGCPLRAKADGDTAPIAICRAALIATRAKKPAEMES